MKINLKDKKALIGGSSNGVGYAVAKQLAVCGAMVTLVSRNEPLLKKNMIFSNEPGIYRPNIDGYRTISSMIVDVNNGKQISSFLDNSIDHRIINLN